MKTLSPHDLFCRCADGDAGAWDELLRGFGAWLYAAIARASGGPSVRDPDEATELLQEVWCRLLARRGSLLRAFRGTTRGEAAAYLAAVARSVTADHQRRQTAKKRQVRLVALGALEMVDLAAGPEERLLGRERRQTLQRRLHEVIGPQSSRRSRRTIELAFVDGLSSGEISRRSRGRTSAAAVDSLVHRVRNRLAARGLRLPKR